MTWPARGRSAGVAVNPFAEAPFPAHGADARPAEAIFSWFYPALT
jgi:hypothetical protein